MINSQYLKQLASGMSTPKTDGYLQSLQQKMSGTTPNLGIPDDEFDNDVNELIRGGKTPQEISSMIDGLPEITNKDEAKRRLSTFQTTPQMTTNRLSDIVPKPIKEFGRGFMADPLQALEETRKTEDLTPFVIGAALGTSPGGMGARAIVKAPKTAVKLFKAGEKVITDLGVFKVLRDQKASEKLVSLIDDAGRKISSAVREIRRVGKVPTEAIQTLEHDKALIETLRGTKGMTAADITNKFPDIQLKRDVSATDIYGVKKIIPEGEALTPYELKGNKILLQDGETYIVSKNQYANIKGNAVSGEAKPFAPELKGTEETIKGYKITEDDIKALRNDELGQDMTRQDAIDYLKNEEHNVDNAPKFESYQLPEGKNYKEILIKAPVEKPSGLFTAEYTKQLQQGTFKSSHWGEPNVISHLRMNERTYKGKKVTFMEELQSDWARSQREMTAKAQSGANFIPEKGHPLLKNWQELSVKRALKEAVDNNSEYLAWISGEQTSARYNLATHLDDVSWKTGGANNSYKRIELTATGRARGEDMAVVINKDGKILETLRSTPNEWQGKKLDEVIGKGLADKIMEKETGQLSGEGLAFGGEWAKNLYDKQVKNIVEDLTGHKTEIIDLKLPVEGKTKAITYIKNRENVPLTKETAKVGKQITVDNSEYIITDLGDGKFKAVPKESLRKPPAPYNKSPYNIVSSNLEDIPEGMKQTFDISTKKSPGQQAIKITPEIRAMVKGESPILKKK